MRLTCPNCEATYEVPDDVIPEAGRDVQCSNCGDTWFQHHPDHTPDPSENSDVDHWEDPSAPEDEDDLPDLGRSTAEAPGAGLAPEAETEDSAEDIARDMWQDPEPEDQDDMAEDTPAPGATQPRRTLDPEVSDILQEEAEREARARAEERARLETQPELGLDEEDEASRRSREARSRMARLRGEPEPDSDDEIASATIDPTSRRDLLPDIDEINSSLRSEGEAEAGSFNEDDYPALPGRKLSGFRSGFFLVLLIAGLALLAYIFAPMIKEHLPQSAKVVDNYVAQVDELRLWIDDQARLLLAWLDSKSGGATGE
ncbi:zinc-ribbon domain-containing protein [Roseovarius sp. C7]|uniref:zinc-ribbon domain-containing protein n=1 Tax=Roseovarius sp. C7 TaxID=3398643 RepID=UPI0039F64B32